MFADIQEVCFPTDSVLEFLFFIVHFKLSQMISHPYEKYCHLGPESSIAWTSNEESSVRSE